MKLNYTSFKERFINSFEYDLGFEFEEEDLNEEYTNFREFQEREDVLRDDIDDFYYWLESYYMDNTCDTHEFWIKPIGPKHGPISMDQVFESYQVYSQGNAWKKFFEIKKPHVEKEMNAMKCGPIAAAINMYLPQPSRHGFGLILAAGYEMMLDEIRGKVKQSISESVQTIRGLSRLGEDLKK